MLIVLAFAGIFNNYDIHVSPMACRPMLKSRLRRDLNILRGETGVSALAVKSALPREARLLSENTPKNLRATHP